MMMPWRLLVNGSGRRFAAALLPRLFGKNTRSHHKGATGRVRTGDSWRVGVETNGCQFYAIANFKLNLGKTSESLRV